MATILPPSGSRATIADFDKLEPETRVELIRGELLREPAPTYRHQRAIMRLTLALGNHVAIEAAGEILIAPIDVELGEHDVFQPDVIFISNERVGIITERRIVGAPDLVVEVLSPSNAYYDLRIKKAVYESSGVREYWIVDPMLETVEVLIEGAAGFAVACTASGDQPVRSTVLPSLTLTAVAIFA